ncbi:hypothetical protein B0G38_003307, partial [Arthrobacter sp. VKM Ac-2550]|nr:hypothetical protein [Arthrobacter sp. VKM Ac-2550]
MPGTVTVLGAAVGRGVEGGFPATCYALDSAARFASSRYVFSVACAVKR